MDMLRNSACIKLFSELEISGECIIYTGSGVGKGGYGRITVASNGERRSYSAHRLAYEMKHGEIPSGVLVRHTCHNPACVRPSHLKRVPISIMLETGLRLVGVRHKMVRRMGMRN